MSLDLFRLDGRVALITGASKGLGKAIAEGLAAAGADVVLVSRNLEAVRQVAEEIGNKTGRRTLGLAADVTVASQVEAMVQEAIGTLGGIDILINNAGINVRKPITEFTEAEWHRVVETNLTGPFLCCRAVARHMIERRSGCVINLGSTMGEVALPDRVAYCSSKGGVHLMTRVLALEWAPYNIRVNAISPGPFLTEMNVPLVSNPEVNSFFVSRIPLGRFGHLKEIMGAAIYLASDAASFVTGHTLFVDGGWTAQ